MKYVKMVLVHLLILTAIAGIIYGHTRVWVANKEKAIQQEQIKSLQLENERLKAQS